MVHTRSKSGVSEGPLPSLDGATEEERSISSILGHLGLTTERARVDTIESIRGEGSHYLARLHEFPRLNQCVMNGQEEPRTAFTYAR